MTDEFDEENETEGTPKREPLDPNIRKELREAQATKQELADLKRSVIFDKAGIPEDGLGSMFRNGYNGDVSVQAVKAKATEYGLLKAAPVQIDETSNDSELEALRRTQGATTGGDSAQPDPQQAFLEALAAAKTPEDVMAVSRGDLGRRLGIVTVGSQQ